MKKDTVLRILAGIGIVLALCAVEVLWAILMGDV
jgi:hypothetical protein